MAILRINRAKVKMNTVLNNNLKYAALYRTGSYSAGQTINISSTLSKSDGSQCFVNIFGTTDTNGDWVTRNNFSNISYNETTGQFSNVTYITNFFVSKNNPTSLLVFTKEVGNAKPIQAIIKIPEINVPYDTAVFVNEIKIELS